MVLHITQHLFVMLLREDCIKMASDIQAYDLILFCTVSVFLFFFFFLLTIILFTNVKADYLTQKNLCRNATCYLCKQFSAILVCMNPK